MSQPLQYINNLGGLISLFPEDQIAERNATDILNMDLSIPGLIQTSKGFRKFGNVIAGVGKGNRGFLYVKNYGTFKRLKMRVRDDLTNTILEWFNPNSPDNDDGVWEILIANLTTGKLMGFSPFNNTNKNQLIFCNAVENLSQWNGATATIASITSDTIVCNEGLLLEGFTATGSVVIGGVTYAYTGITDETFTGVTADPTAAAHAIVAGDGVAQLPDTTTLSGNPKGNILLTAQARLWLSGVPTRESTMYYSEVGDATNFTVGTNPDDPGIEDFPDSGGAITCLDKLSKDTIVIHKEDGILSFKLDYTATAQVPILDVISLSPDSGATNLKANAGLNQSAYFVSGVEGIKSLQKAIEDSDLNLSSITDVILPTLSGYDFSDAACIYYPKKRVILAACKDDPDLDYNNRVIAYFIRKNIDGSYIGDISILNWLVADWIVDKDKLYFLSSLSQNTYLAFDDFTKDGSAMNHRWVSKAFTLGRPGEGKEFSTVYVDGFIRNGTKIKISIDYGILGIEGQKPVVLKWNDEPYVHKQKVSSLGVDVLGTTSLGAASEDILDSYPFSMQIHVDVQKTNRFKIRIETEYDSETSNSTYWAISNIGFDPRIYGVDTEKTKNTNL